MGISNYMGVGQYAAIGAVNEACAAVILRDWYTSLADCDVDYSWGSCCSSVCKEVWTQKERGRGGRRRGKRFSCMICASQGSAGLFSKTCAEQASVT